MVIRIRQATCLLAAASVILGACSTAGLQASPTAAPRTIDLTVSEETFEPARIDVRRGETVVFRLRNLSNEGHEAYFGTEEQQRQHEAAHSALPPEEQTETTHGYGVHIAPFGTGELAFAFDTGDEYVIGCHYPGHYDAGMVVVVTVTD